jgi:hypothetical protein
MLSTTQLVRTEIQVLENHPQWLMYSLGVSIIILAVGKGQGNRKDSVMLDIMVGSNQFMIMGCVMSLILALSLIDAGIFGPLVSILIGCHTVVLSMCFGARRLIWCIEEGCQNILITGGIGSGKTNGINFLAWELTKCQPLWGGLWLDNKGNSHEDLAIILEKHGRLKDIRILNVRGKPSLFYNVLEDPAFTPETLGSAIAEVSGDDGGKNAAFFKKQAALHCTEAIKGLKALGRRATFGSLYSNLTDLNATTELIEKLRKSQHPDSARIATHFESKFVAMPGDQFGGVTGTITNCLYPFVTPEIAEVTGSDKPNGFSFSDLDHGAVLCLSLPQVHLKERLALNALLKQLYYQFGMMRYDRSQKGLTLPPLVLWLDEGHHSLRSGEAGDYMFLDRLRAARCAAIVGMQGPDSPVPMLGQDVTEATIKHLRSWFIFSPADSKAKRAIQDYIGKHEVLKTTTGISGGRTSISRTPHDEYILKDQDLNGLKNYRCHVYHVGTKRLTKFVKLPQCEPAKGILPK